MIGREKCILLTMISNVHHATKSFFFISYRPNSPNKILGLWSSIIVKMMDEHSDLPSNFTQFYFLPPIILYHHDDRWLFFYFKMEGLFAVLTHCVRQKAPGYLYPIHPSMVFFTEKLVIKIHIVEHNTLIIKFSYSRRMKRKYYSYIIVIHFYTHIFWCALL